MLDKMRLESDGSFPKQLNYQGQPFMLKDILGDLIRDKDTGDAIQKKDTSTGRFWDKKGKEVNRRGYLVDRKGNIIDKKNKKIFAKEELDETGEIPKLFKFTIFDQ